MRRSGKLAAVALVSLLGSACHKRTLPAPPPVPTQTTRTHPAGPTAPEPVQPPQPQPPPEFRLGQALTPEELRANNALIDRHLQHATQALASIGKRQLSNEQKSTAAQIRGFIDQAQQMRGTDILRARSLAERADVLAQDLLSRLR